MHDLSLLILYNKNASKKTQVQEQMKMYSAIVLKPDILIIFVNCLDDDI